LKEEFNGVTNSELQDHLSTISSLKAQLESSTKEKKIIKDKFNTLLLNYNSLKDSMTKIKSIISIQPLLSDNIITYNDFDKKLDKITSHHKANTLYKPELSKYKEYAIANDLELFEIDSINKYL
jgi:hypothetical protein